MIVLPSITTAEDLNRLLPPLFTLIWYALFIQRALHIYFNNFTYVKCTNMSVLCDTYYIQYNVFIQYVYLYIC